jgi:2'-5' RNA ligase
VEPTQTAVIVPVAAAEPVVADHRRRLDRSSAWGVPAHVTVLFPFVPPADVDDRVVGRLRDVCATVPAFDCTFAECGWFGDGVLWLDPDPGQQFRDLTRRVSDEFPGFAPYGGAFDDVVPHLTVGESESVDELRAAELDVSGHLPFVARVEHALLIAGTDQPDSWRTVAELPLGTSIGRLLGA